MSNEVKVKIKPYPFTALLEVGAVKKPVDVIFISPKGIIAEVHDILLTVGAYIQVEFTLPTTDVQVLTKMRIFKTYDKVIDTHGKIQRLAELQFEDLPKEQRAKIAAFNQAIGQK